MALALERQHRVHHVLQHLGPGQGAVLRDVADQHRRDVLPLGREQELRRRLAHLPDAARRRLELVGPHRLHRVHDDQRRLEPRHLFEDALEAGLRQQIQRRLRPRPADRRGSSPGARTPRPRRTAPGPRRGRSAPPPAAAAWTCRCRVRRRAAPASPARRRRRARDRTRRCRWTGAPLARLDVGVQRRACSARPAARSGVVGAAVPVSTARSSTSVFQPPHSAQRPIHFGACAPHSWQTNTTFGAFIRTPARTRVPSRHTISHGIVPIDAAISRASICCHLSSPCRPMITTSSPGSHVAEPGDVHGHHVHRHRADDRRAMAANQHRAAAASRVSRPSA